MESLEIVSLTKDLRTNTNVIYAKIKINDYLALVGDDFNKFEIQRRKEYHKGYKRLKKDIERGALIPTITLAIEPSKVETFTELLARPEDKNAIKEHLKTLSGNIYILDGLQRTYIIKEIVDSNTELMEEQYLLLEIWLEPNTNHLIYRLIVLNSGQKPMSMRHQIEILFMTMKTTLMNRVEGLVILLEKNEDRRTKAKEFTFERLVTAYKAYLTKTSEIDKDNFINERMIESEILDSEEDSLSESFLKYIEILKTYCLLDEQAFRIYNGSELNKYRNWFADSNVIISFFAAVKSFSTDADRERIVSSAIAKLKTKLENANSGTDELSIVVLNNLLSDVSVSKKYNVGYATRKVLTGAFVEFFRYEGELPMSDCWNKAFADL